MAYFNNGGGGSMNAKTEEKIDAIYEKVVNNVNDRVFAFCGQNNSFGIIPLEYQGFSVGSTAGSLKVLESGRYAFWFQGCGNEPVQERLLVNGNVLIFGGNIYYFQRYTGDEASASSVKNMGWTIPAEATLVSTGTVTEPWVFDIEANVEITANVTKGTNGYASLYIYKVE